jgi:uncharacterized protein (TIGR02145 family)
MEDSMRKLGLWERAIIVVAAMLAATVLSCASNAKTSAAPQSGTSTGTKIKYVAVVETEIDAQSGASAELNPAEVRQITAALRREAVENLPRGTYNIMTSETIQSMGGAVLEECADENCVITLGSKIGADYIVRGIISKYGAKFTMSVEMYETDNGMLVASSEYVRADNTAELMDKAVVASANMYRKFVNPPMQQPAVAAQQSVNQSPAPMNQSSGASGSGTFTDSRDGKKYKTVVIDGKRWMAENLNINRGDSWCYNNDNSNCDKYGRLYDWNTAKKVCPAGFHLPSRPEWDNLTAAAGGRMAAGKKLKAGSGWENRADGTDGNGTDDFGFSALPGGFHYSGYFEAAAQYGHWWTDEEHSSGSAYLRGMLYNYDFVFDGNYDKDFGYSVRCVADSK